MLKDKLATYYSRRQVAKKNKSIQGDTDYFFATLSKHPQGKRPRIEPGVETNNHSTPNLITERHLNNVKSPTNANKIDNVLHFASPLGDSPKDSRRSTLKDFEDSVGQMDDSIWDRQFPSMELVDAHFRKEKDREKVRKLGLRNSSRAITTFGVRTAFLSREIESELGRLDQENCALHLVDVKKKLQEMQSQLEMIASEKAIWEKNLVSEKSRLDTALAKIEEMKREFAFQNSAAFDKAISQDGKLVDQFPKP
ncbi:hypothetical protein SESBI_08957 [Sesbania bispinosa]|nr:hypothetical protein SESBI_08957 [Sesbania bispinosa]